MTSNNEKKFFKTKSTTPSVDKSSLLNDILEAPSYKSIPDAYAGRSVFITGGTGFIGKVLTEKLLRSCPEINQIYLLIRPKRGQEIEERLTTLLNEPIFEPLRKQNPKQLLKIISIAGDVASDELGISQRDQALLCENVSIVFHSAANVRFDEPLKVAANINMLGTRRVIQLCQRMKNLNALIHVSTALTNCNRPDIDETLYEMSYKPNDILALVEKFPEEIVAQITPSILDERPNTYLFTKALAEHMVFEEADNLPADIVRPAIIISALKEPLVGWIDNFYGPTGMVIGFANGLLRTLPVDPKCVAHLVPVDIVVNLLITAAWYRMSNRSQQLRVYNCCSFQRNPITWEHFVQNLEKIGWHYPLAECMWYPANISKVRQKSSIGLSLPLYIGALVSGNWAKRHKIHGFLKTIEYFTRSHWDLKDKNVVELLHVLNAEDREKFMFDVTEIKWPEYIHDYFLGIRQYLLKQGRETLPASKKRLSRLWYLHQLVKFTTLLIGFMVIKSFLWTLWK